MSEPITIPQWHEMATLGKEIPMRIPIHGISMQPLIRMDRDMVTIVPLAEKPAIGDIVLFKDVERELYVLHRVWDIREENVLTWGDNCDRPDGWIPWDQLWGKAILIERGKMTIHPKPKSGFLYAWVWHRLRDRYKRFRAKGSIIKHKLKNLIG